MIVYINLNKLNVCCNSAQFPFCPSGNGDWQTGTRGYAPPPAAQDHGRISAITVTTGNQYTADTINPRCTAGEKPTQRKMAS